MFSMDPRAQFEFLRQQRGSEPALANLLEEMCNTLAMGMEEYIRVFDAERGIALLCDIGSNNIKMNGDAATMCLRCLSLILEHVPRAIDVASAQGDLIPLVKLKFSLMHELKFEQHTVSSLCEDALRIVSFLAEGGNIVPLTTCGLLKDITVAMDRLDSASVGRCLAAIAAVLNRVVLPHFNVRHGLTPPKPEPSKKDAKKKDKSPSKSPPTHLTADKAAVLRRELAETVVPKIKDLLAATTAATVPLGNLDEDSSPSRSSAADRDQWPIIERAVECLDVLLYRLALAAHPRLADGSGCVISPWIVPVTGVLSRDPLTALVAGPDTASYFLAALVRFANTEKKQLTILSALANMAMFRRECIMIPLLEREVVDFFTDILAPTRRDLSSLLTNCFPRRTHLMATPGGGASNTSSGTTASNTNSALVTTAAVYFLQLMAPPLSATETKVHYRAIPLHVWEWCDDMHTFTEYTDEACLLLESARLAMHPTIPIKVRSNTYRVDMDTLKQISPNNQQRPVRRTPYPKMFTFVDWDARVAAFAGRLIPPEDSPSDNGSSTASTDDSVQFFAIYGPVMMSFAGSASNEIVRSLAVSSVVRSLSAMATPFPSASFYRTLESMLDQIGAFLANILSAADDLVTIDGVFILVKLLFAVATQDSTVEVVTPKHRPNPDAEVVGDFTVSSFARACRRFGVVKKIQSLSARLNVKFGRDRAATDSCPIVGGSSAILARAADLESLCEARHKSLEGDATVDDSIACSPVDLSQPASSPTGQMGPVAALVELFRSSSTTDELRESLLFEIVQALGKQPNMTVHEYGSIHLTGALAKFLCGSTVATDTTVSAASAPEQMLRRRLSLFSSALQQNPAAATLLVRMLVSELALTSKRLAEVQGVGTRVADKCRPWTEALQRLAAISPHVDLCCNKEFNVRAAAAQPATASSNSPPDSPNEQLRCPSGHILRRETHSHWSCNLCNRDYDADTALACRDCNFDVCQRCLSRGYGTGRAPADATAERLPGVRTHLLATIGDIESHFRKPLEERYISRTGSRVAEVLAQMDVLQNMLGMAGSAERTPGGIADLVRMMAAGPLQRQADDRMRPMTDAVPPLKGESRRALFYAGLGRVPYQESLFSCLYRKAMGLGIAGAITAFEDAVMISPKTTSEAEEAQSPIGTPVRSMPPYRPSSPPHSPNEAHTAAGFNPRRTYYLHVPDENSRTTGLCCCGDVDVRPDHLVERSLSPVASEDMKSPTSAESPTRPLFRDAALRAGVLLAAESPTALALRQPELEGTGRFMLLRILWTLCVDAALRDVDGIPSLAAPLVPPEQFVCHDLGVKAVKSVAASALRVALMAPQFALPGWLVEVLYHAPYLLALSIRQQLLYFIAVGARRALAESVSSQGFFGSQVGAVDISPSEWSASYRSPSKQIVRREPHFEKDAFDALLNASEKRTSLTFAFQGDQGLGLGPTQQFYTMVAEALLRTNRKLWRGDDDDDADRKNPSHLMHIPHEGLFPLPHAVNNTATRVEDQEARRRAFYLAGAACGRALIDGRLFPLPLSPAMFGYLRRRLGLSPRRKGGPASTHRYSDMRQVDAGLAQSLMMLMQLRDRAFRGDEAAAAEIDGLGLTFVLPGHDEIELIPQGKDTPVTRANIGSYIDSTLFAVLEGTVESELDAFAVGFADVAPPDCLLALEPNHIVSTIVGFGGAETGRPLWSKEELVRCLRGDHGYSRDSKEISWLRDILVQFNVAQQRAFLTFCTGCPRLPMGGLPALGVITVVRKDPADGSSILGLPSVNTCFRYLKMPPYASMEAMREGLLTAVLDGGDRFDLS